MTLLEKSDKKIPQSLVVAERFNIKITNDELI